MKVLFLCTGNSCRSQMAEAVVNSHPEWGWRAFSAGTRPGGYVHPLAIQSLAEIDIPHDGCSKGLESVGSETFDLIVTVCDSAAEECPFWPGQGKMVHQGYPDPAAVIGSPDDQLAAFREVRTRMLDDLPQLLLQNKSI